MTQRVRIQWLVGLLAISFGLLMATSLSAAETNLVENGSFENVDGNGKAVGFDFWLAEGDVSITVVDNVARTGERSVRIAGSKTPRGGVTLRKNIEGGETYQFSVWYRYDISGPWESPTKGVPWMGHHVLMRLMAYDENGKKIPWDEEWLVDPNEGWFDIRENMHVLPAPWDFAGPEDWLSLNVTVSFPEEATRIELNLFNWYGEGEVYYDDLSMLKL